MAAHPWTIDRLPQSCIWAPSHRVFSHRLLFSYIPLHFVSFRRSFGLFSRSFPFGLNSTVATLRQRTLDDPHVHGFVPVDTSTHLGFSLHRRWERRFFFAMGACTSVQDRTEKGGSDETDRTIKRDSRNFRKECKILLLGELGAS